MKCLVCLQKINPGEEVFWGTQMSCSGYGDNDCEYSEALEGIMGAVHLICLQSPSDTPRSSNIAIDEPVLVIDRTSKEGSMVERSDALSIFRV